MNTGTQIGANMKEQRRGKAWTKIFEDVPAAVMGEIEPYIQSRYLNGDVIIDLPGHDRIVASYYEAEERREYQVGLIEGDGVKCRTMQYTLADALIAAEKPAEAAGTRGNRIAQEVIYGSTRGCSTMILKVDERRDYTFFVSKPEKVTEIRDQLRALLARQIDRAYADGVAAGRNTYTSPAAEKRFNYIPVLPCRKCGRPKRADEWCGCWNNPDYTASMDPCRDACLAPLGCDCPACVAKFGPIHPGNVGKDLRSNPTGQVSNPRKA